MPLTEQRIEKTKAPLLPSDYCDPAIGKSALEMFLTQADSAEIDGLRAMLIKTPLYDRDHDIEYKRIVNGVNNLSKERIEEYIAYDNANRGGKELSRAIHDLQDYASGKKTGWEGSKIEKQEAAIEACKQFAEKHPKVLRVVDSECFAYKYPIASEDGRYSTAPNTKSFKVCSAHQVYNMPNAQSK